jgi:hypothetical protein
MKRMGRSTKWQKPRGSLLPVVGEMLVLSLAPPPSIHHHHHLDHHQHHHRPDNEGFASTAPLLGIGIIEVVTPQTLL